VHSIALVKFAGRDDQYVVVGTVKDLQLRPRSLTCGYLVLYKLAQTGDQLELVHRTEVDDVPAAIAPFQGRLLVGVGRYLRIYDYGKKKLLRKCENKVSRALPSLSHPFNGPFSRITRVSQYQKGKTSLDFTGARDGE